MRAVVQRALSGRVLVGGEVVGELGRPGLVVLVGVTHGDTEVEAGSLATRLWHLRVLEDGQGKMNRSCAEVGAPLLVVSQFTLYAETRRGRRPSFGAAMPPSGAELLVDELVSCLRRLGATVETGVFGADMQLELVNDGPVTVILDS